MTAEPSKEPFSGVCRVVPATRPCPEGRRAVTRPELHLTGLRRRDGVISLAQHDFLILSATQNKFKYPCMMLTGFSHCLGHCFCSFFVCFLDSPSWRSASAWWISGGNSVTRQLPPRGEEGAGCPRGRLLGCADHS